MDPSLPLESEDGLLRFTPTEATIFGRLLVTAGRTKSQLRVAGGWVRDKLLGIDSKDLDVAVNNMSGLEFARALATDMRVSVSVVRANPAQSKHLETAIVSIEGLHVDFVNLRAEEYTDASRIPVMVRARRTALRGRTQVRGVGGVRGMHSGRRCPKRMQGAGTSPLMRCFSTCTPAASRILLPRCGAALSACPTLSLTCGSPGAGRPA